MIRFIRLTAVASLAALWLPGAAFADMATDVSIPDPAQAWQARDLSTVQDWLASTEGAALEGEKAVAALRARAWLARREGDSARALDLLGQAVEMAPDRPDLRVDRASFRSDLIEEAGRLKSLRIARDVRKDLDYALEIEPEHVDALAALAGFHLRAPGIAGGDRQEAAALLDRLEQLAPSRRSFREAEELADDERFDEAVQRLAEAIAQADRPRPNWQLRMGDWLDRLGRVDRAMDAYEEAIVQAPQHSEALYALGRLAARSGLAEDAGIEALQRYLALPRWPDDPEPKLAWWHLGRIHANAGCVAQAEAAFQRALALDPDWRDAQRSLESLADVQRPTRPCEPRAELPPAG